MAILIFDSLLFSSTDQMMDHMKDILSSEWEVIDLGEPHKFISIKVTCTNNSISISQQKFTSQKKYARCEPCCCTYGPEY